MPEIAGRGGARHHTVMIVCMPISDVIGQHGVPDYMKVDIEGYDRACIAGLSADIAPPYISIEMGHPEGGADIDVLYDLGYRGFKIICQNNLWWPARLSNIGLYERHHRHPIGRATSKFGKMWVQLAGRAVGESGPWGEATDG